MGLTQLLKENDQYLKERVTYKETFDEFCRSMLALNKGEPDQRRYLADLLYQWNENKRRASK